MLIVNDIHVYIQESYVLQGVSIKINTEEIVCLLGRNGAGKTTTIKSIVGYYHPTKGNITFKGQDITHSPVYKNIRLGLGFVPEDRRIFPDLTVEENFEVAMIKATKGKWTIEKIFDEIPILAKLRKRKGGELSGGEQQMVAIGRALATNPELLLLDEPCEGLAPVIVEKLGEIILNLKKEIPILLSEQNAHFALDISDRGYIIDKGKIVYKGTVKELRENKEIQSKYLAV